MVRVDSNKILTITTTHIDSQAQAALNLQLIDEAELGNIPAMAQLLANGAQINGFARSITPLMAAAGKGHLEAVKFLLAQGAFLNASSIQNSNTALMYAAMNHHPHVVNFFIHIGAKLDCQNVYGSTAFTRAVLLDYKSISFSLLCAMPAQDIITIQKTNRYNEIVNSCKNFIINNQEILLEILSIFEEPNSSVKGLFLDLPIELLAKILQEAKLFEHPYPFRLIEDINYILNNNKPMTFLPLENKGTKRKADEMLESDDLKEQKTFLPLALAQGTKRKAKADLNDQRKKYQKTEQGEKDTTDLTNQNKPGK